MNGLAFKKNIVMDIHKESEQIKLKKTVVYCNTDRIGSSGPGSPLQKLGFRISMGKQTPLG